MISWITIVLEMVHSRCTKFLRE